MPPEDNPVLDMPTDREEYEAWEQSQAGPAAEPGEIVDAEFTVEQPASRLTAHEVTALAIEDEIAKCEREIVAIKQQYMYAKAQKEEAIERLREHTRSLREPKLPFPEEAEPYDAWQGQSLTSALIGVSAKVLESMGEQGLRTVGDLQEYLESHTLSDLKGVGEKKSEMVESALEEFWKRWNEKHPAPQEPVEADDHADEQEQ